MSKGRILVADDDEDILKAISLRLKANGYDVVVAVDAIQAVMKAHREKPDVAVLDIHMPAGDAMEVIRSFESDSDTSGIPVVLVTADTQASTRDRGVASGAKHYLTKPFLPSELLECVEDALAAR